MHPLSIPQDKTLLPISLPEECLPPPLATTTDRLMHRLPLPFHLLRTITVSTLSVTESILSHILSGPVRSGWSLSTSALVALLKSQITSHPPQGRHSYPIVSTALRAPIPSFLFSSTIQIVQLHIDNDHSLLEHMNQILQHNKLLRPIQVHEERLLDTEWIIPSQLKSDSIILYFHGGGHLFGGPAAHRGVTTAIAEQTGMRVVVPDYRLAKENPFPSALIDALACYHSLFMDPSKWQSLDFKGINATQIYVAGDSSGSALCLQLIRMIDHLRWPMPGKAVFLSPFVDAELHNSSWRANWHTDFMNMDYHGMKWALKVYANGLDLSHPLISPVKGCFASHFPPCLIVSISITIDLVSKQETEKFCWMTPFNYSEGSNLKTYPFN
jgi:acetyl esterase/lipase